MAAKAKTSSKTGSRTSTKTATKKVSSKLSSSKEMPKDMMVSDESTSMKSENMMNRKMGGKKTLFLLALAAVVLGLLYYYKSLFVVATVNGKPITRMAVVSDLEKQNGKGALDNLVTKELILQEASKKGITVTQADIDGELSKIEDQLKAQGQTLDQVLTTQGLTKADVSDNLRVKLYIERILDDKVSVSDDDAKKYYDDNKASFPKDKSFDDQKDQIKDQLKQQKLQEEYQKWMDDLKANAKINYFKTY